MDGYPWARLQPLPEAVVASMTLRGLPGVEARLPIGWSPAGLILATHITAGLPGCGLWIEQRDGRIRFEVSGGTLLTVSDPAGRSISDRVNSTASQMCELCGRPARGREKPTRTYCDACESLRGRQAQATLAFKPRLPLTVEAEEAHNWLAEHSGLDSIPAGWARQVRSTIRDLGDTSATGNYAIVSLPDHVAMYLLDGHIDNFPFFSTRLENETRRRCQHCGRGADNERHPGVCDGCRMLHNREQKILPAHQDGTDER